MLLLASNLIEFDQQIFSLINSEWDSSVLDPIMVTVRNKYFWIPFYLFLLSYIIYNFRNRAWAYLFFFIAAIGCADYTSSSIIKPLIQRPRPCHPDGLGNVVDLLINCGSGYSFTSSHATNHFAIAFFLIFTMPMKRKYIFAPLFLWAAMISYAQVYVGVHYPVDVLAGALLGTSIALMFAEMYSYYLRRFQPVKDSK